MNMNQRLLLFFGFNLCGVIMWYSNSDMNENIKFESVELNSSVIVTIKKIKSDINKSIRNGKLKGECWCLLNNNIVRYESHELKRDFNIDNMLVRKGVCIYLDKINNTETLKDIIINNVNLIGETDIILEDELKKEINRMKAREPPVNKSKCCVKSKNEHVYTNKIQNRINSVFRKKGFLNE